LNILKQLLSPRLLKEGGGRSGVDKLPIHRKQHSPNEGHLREKFLEPIFNKISNERG
jgi:hypothetical protein